MQSSVFDKIQNPKTGRWVNLNGNTGQKILRNYNMLRGGSEEGGQSEKSKCNQIETLQHNLEKCRRRLAGMQAKLANSTRREPTTTEKAAARARARAKARARAMERARERENMIARKIAWGCPLCDDPGCMSKCSLGKCLH
jgi:hypothetical protein